MRIRTIFVTFAAALALTALAACSSSGSNTSPTFNKADVSFAQDMIPHHRQATEMASMAASRTHNTQVLDLAQQISAAQKPEITLMSGWLKSWGKDVPQEMSGMADSNMPGMMSNADMKALEGSSGTVFDTRFLTMMIQHHKGAIEMAKTEAADGKYSGAVRLAGQIQKDQNAEILTMESQLKS